ncbi:MAG: hypothetical protein ACO23H_08385 [Alphaproteobacteria bacterium]|jgi:TPR repeat protein|nr:sel1 repeat family protein [Paracoccaceae bacterium]NDH26888.1 sel1 repeat family protein [Paracoccaceae bacterium]
MTLHTTTKIAILSLFLSASALLAPVAVATNPETLVENRAFKEAVKAVKNGNYAHAITLFEAQANLPRYDAQYNLAVLLNAGKGRPRNYVEALYWSWQAQLGGIEDAEDLANDIVDLLPPKTTDEVRNRVADALQKRIENKDLTAISQLANYHLTIMAEPDYENAYIWYSIAVALNLPETTDARDDSESQIDTKNLVDLQIKSQRLFEKYNFKPLQTQRKGDKNDS